MRATALQHGTESKFIANWTRAGPTWTCRPNGLAKTHMDRRGPANKDSVAMFLLGSRSVVATMRPKRSSLRNLPAGLLKVLLRHNLPCLVQKGCYQNLTEIHLLSEDWSWKRLVIPFRHPVGKTLSCGPCAGPAVPRTSHAALAAPCRSFHQKAMWLNCVARVHAGPRRAGERSIL